MFRVLVIIYRFVCVCVGGGECGRFLLPRRSAYVIPPEIFHRKYGGMKNTLYTVYNVFFIPPYLRWKISRYPLSFLQSNVLLLHASFPTLLRVYVISFSIASPLLSGTNLSRFVAY